MYRRLFLLTFLSFCFPSAALFELKTVTEAHIERFLHNGPSGTDGSACSALDTLPNVPSFFAHGYSYRIMRSIKEACLPSVTSYQADLNNPRSSGDQRSDSLVRIPGIPLLCRPQKCLRYGVTREFRVPESGEYSIEVIGEAVTWFFLDGEQLANPFDTLTDWSGPVVGAAEVLPMDSGRGYRIEEVYLDSGEHLFEYYRLGTDTLMSTLVAKWKPPSKSEFQIIPPQCFSKEIVPEPPEIEFDSCWIGNRLVEGNHLILDVPSDTSVSLKVRILNETSRFGDHEFRWDMGDGTIRHTKDPVVTHTYQNLSRFDSPVRPIAWIVYDSILYSYGFSIWSFRQEPYHPPYYPPEENAPKLVIVPFGGDTIQERMVRFEWHKHSECDSYLVHASRDIIWDSHDLLRHTVYNTGALQVSIQPGKYYWRACCGTNESGCSSVDSFVVAGSLNASRNSTLDPEKYLAVRFLHSGSLHYVALPERRPSLVEFKIYSINGSLLYSDQHSGSKLLHTIDIYDDPTRPIVPGVYLLQVKAGSLRKSVRIGLE